MTKQQNNFDIDRQWDKEQDKQILNWKYGKVLIVKHRPPHKEILLLTNQPQTQPSHTILITTYPFTASNQLSYNNNNILIPTLLIQSSEQNKSFQFLQKIIEFLLQQKSTRNTHIIVQGGGMLMDLVNFAASIYMRGVKNVTLIPTTLLGMVDATVGGKNAINYQNIKNIIGTTRNPQTIIISPQYLLTQSQRQFNNGLIQTIKMAITYDKAFFQFLQSINFQSLRHPQNQQKLQYIIKKSISMKINVVERFILKKLKKMAKFWAYYCTCNRIKLKQYLIAW